MAHDLGQGRTAGLEGDYRRWWPASSGGILAVMGAFVRLTASDQTNLAVEAADTPMHQAALGVLRAGPLLDAGGRLRIEMIRRHVAARLDRVPEMRRILHRTGPLGAELWIDDPNFKIENHVLLAALPPPGGEAQALAFAERRLETLMDRSRPLWEMWFLEGYAQDRVAILVKLHHALADGPAMLNVIGQIFDIEPDVVTERPSTWRPAARPTLLELLRDNLRRSAGWLRRIASSLRHPVAVVKSAAAAYHGAIEEIRQGRGAPATSINRPIEASRRLAVDRLPLAEVKAVAHERGVKLNDVFLAVVAGGLRAVLLARGEPVDGVRLRASVAVSLHRPGDATTWGNLVGTIIVPLPMDGDDAGVRLGRIAEASVRAKTTQRAVVNPHVMVWLARSRLARLYIRRQHFINVLTTNLPGPPVPLYFAGARLVDAIAVPPIAGNVTVSFAALSYDGNLNLSAVADAGSWPDLDVLQEGMRASWLELKRSPSRLQSDGQGRAFPALAAVRT
ncbi:MAG TPA: wax ester/triacylglycerol synthase family O-acyltransferase [Candidatus Dormibacteraeota bacterium]|nr:wax ester/triacylglycerol synthase family O-acyltransferase [Candidatus Dormibacteraeota bacterium]